MTHNTLFLVVGHLRQSFERLSEVPFSSETKWMAVQCVDRTVTDAVPLFYAKGATEVFVNRCGTYYLNNGTLAAMSDDVRLQFCEVAREVRAHPATGIS